MGAGRRRRRRRYDADRRLEVAATVGAIATTPPRWPRFGRLAEAVIRRLPTHEDSERGRASAAIVRAALAALAIALVTQGKGQAALPILGVVVALFLIVVPVSESRSRRWREAAAQLGAPREHLVATPAAITYDGHKLTVTSDGKVWRSVRPRKSGCTVTVVRRGEDAVIGLVTARRALWFAGPGAEVEGRTYDPIVETRRRAAEEARAEDTVTVDAEAWITLHEALWDPRKQGVPDPRGPAQATGG